MTNRNGPPEKIWRLAGSISQPGPKTEARACPSLFSAPSPTWEHCLRIKIPSCCAEARSKAQPLNDRSSLPLSDIDSQEEPQREHTPFIRSCMCGLNLVTHPCCQPERSVAGDWSFICSLWSLAEPLTQASPADAWLFNTPCPRDRESLPAPGQRDLGTSPSMHLGRAS